MEGDTRLKMTNRVRTCVKRRVEKEKVRDAWKEKRGDGEIQRIAGMQGE